MQTPNNPAGKITEEIMQHFYDTFDLEVADYNRAYQHVYDVLTKHLMPKVNRNAE